MEFRADVRVVKPLNIRSGGPYLSQTIARREEIGALLQTSERLEGEGVKSNSLWYREEGTGFYFWSGATELIRRVETPDIQSDAKVERLSPHFSLDELTISQEAVRHGIDNTPSDAVLKNLRVLASFLEEVRVVLGGTAIHISSGYRSEALNARINGSPTSAHCRGLAADFTAPAFGGVFETAAAIAASKLPFDQVIYEHGTWVHLGLADTGSTPRRQELSFFGNGYLPGLRRR